MRSHKTRNCTVGLAPCKALALAVAIAACLPAPSPAAAQATVREQTVSFDIPAGDLSVALEQFSIQSGIQAMYRQDVVAGKSARAVSGSLTPSAGLARLLDGTGIASERVNDRTYVLKLVTRPARTNPESQHPKPALDPEADRPKSDVKDIDDIVVVGSRLGSSPLDSAMPIKVITREDIDRSGAVTIAQMLTYLPEVPISNDVDRAPTGLADSGDGSNTNATSIQMRGLPRGTTLVLIDGRRAGESGTFSEQGFFDLSTIPLALVERIEVLPAGASAVYGGDGLSGIINIVLRRDANGFEVRVRRTFADSFGTSQASGMWGKAWSRGNLTIAGNWSKNDALYTSDRSITADTDYRRFGGDDRRAPYASPATIYSLCPHHGYCPTPLEERDNLPGLSSPVAVVPEGSNGIGLVPGDFASTQGQINQQSYTRNLQSPEESYGVAIRGNIEIFRNLEAFTELTYTKRKVPAYEAKLLLTSGLYGFDDSRLPAEHPFNPFGVPVGVNYQYENTGVFVSYGQEHYRGVLGLRGTIGRFDWELSGSQARDKSHSAGSPYFSYDAIAAALRSQDPERTINPFVSDGGAPATPELLRSLVATPLNNNLGTRASSATGFVRGNIWQLPAGNVIGLLGFEAHTTTIDVDRSDSSQVTPQVYGSTRNNAIFGELRVPLMSPRAADGGERVAFTSALRRETGDRFADPALMKTFGIEVRPLDSLMVRSTYSTAFRPPNAYFAAQSAHTQDWWVSDPMFNGEWFQTQMVIGGVSPDLTPEHSKTVTLGMVYRPSSDWSASVTQWSTKFVDQIAYVASGTIIENESLFPGRVHRNPSSGIIEVIDARQVNISLQETSGVDIGIDGTWNTAVGIFYPSMAATYTYRFEQQLKQDEPIVSSLSSYNPDGWAPRWKLVPRLGWDSQGWARTMLVGRYVSKYKDSKALSNGPDIGKVKTLGNFWIVDFNLDLALSGIFKNRQSLSGTSLNIGARNLFNRLPEFCAGCAYGRLGYDSSQYDIMGRSIYAEVRVSL